jgi:uncharacterized membrane protein YhaH (DUF805 family)
MFNFSGRARRAEYWWFALYLFVAALAAQGALLYFMMQDPAFLAAMTSEEAAQAWFKQSPDAMRTAGIFFLGYVVLAWLPQLAVTVRRLHDTDRSGWFIFMPFLAYLVTAIGGVALTILTGGQAATFALLSILIIPTVASIWFLIVLCLPGTHGTNRFGPDPVPNRKRKPPAHPAFAPQLPAEELSELAAHRRSEIKDYYRKHVLTSIQKA